MGEVAAEFNGGWLFHGAGHFLPVKGPEKSRFVHMVGRNIVDEPEPRLPRGFITVNRGRRLDEESRFVSDAWKVAT